MSNKKELRYRVFDKNGYYQQSYSNQLPQGFDWARDCAKRTGGYVVECQLGEAKDIESNIVFDLRNK